jgi:hypothetical protein
MTKFTGPRVDDVGKLMASPTRGQESRTRRRRRERGGSSSGIGERVPRLHLAGMSATLRLSPYRSSTMTSGRREDQFGRRLHRLLLDIRKDIVSARRFDHVEGIRTRRSRRCCEATSPRVRTPAASAAGALRDRRADGAMARSMSAASRSARPADPMRVPTARTVDVISASARCSYE